MIATEGALVPASQPSGAPGEVSVPHEREMRQPSRRYAWGISCAAILLVSVVLRFHKLELKPLHHDEGVNAVFFLHLFRENIYRYDPANYHGPTLYYFALIAASVSTLFRGEDSLNILVLRSVPALFGVATIVLILQLRKYLGTLATLVAAALLAASPGATYFSRDFIHEAIFAFLTLALVVAMLKVSENATWSASLLFSIVAALLFATKETAGISVAVLCLALYATAFRLGRAFSLRNFISRSVDHLGGKHRGMGLLLACAAMFVGLSVILYSSFLGNLGGLYDALRSLRLWASTGTTAHKHGFFTYVFWLATEEWPLLGLGTAGIVFAAFRRKAFPVFVSLWAFGLITAYSFIPYKTPWLTLNFLVPLALTAGYAVSESFNFLRSRSQLLARLCISIICAIMVISLYRSWKLNFYHYDDDHNPYVYGQTRRELLGLVEKINELAKRDGTGFQTSIAIISPDYWPLPWYLRDYSRVGYFGRIIDAQVDIVIATDRQSGPLKDLLGTDYQVVGQYTLRPGVNLVIFARAPTAGF